MNNGRAIIVGGSHAGAQLCASLRQEGWDGEILVVGDEPTLPYHRPPLSKTYLSGKSGISDLLIRPPSFYDQHGINICHARVDIIDRQAQTVTLTDGKQLTLGLTPDGGHLTGGTAGPAGRMSVWRASVRSTPRSFGSRLPAW